MNITGTNPGSYVAIVPAPVAHTKMAAGDMQAMAQALADQTKWLEDDKLSKSTGGTITGPTKLNGAGATTTKRTSNVPAVDSTINQTADIWRCGTPLLALDHEVTDATEEGIEVKVWRAAAGAFDIVLHREDATVIATLPSGTHSSATLTFYASGGWQVTGGFAFV